MTVSGIFDHARTGRGAERRDIVVIGASAGGVEALRSVMAGLPPDFPAAVLVVLHLPAHASSALPEILSRCGPLKARQVTDDEPLRPGRVLVAPPDHHLVVRDGVARVTRGPTENGNRPSIDVLFRSAGSAAGQRVIGVILSGVLDDGTAGAAAIHRRGGTVVVQEPADAIYRGMPENALRQVPVDYVVAAKDVGALLQKLTAEPLTRPDPPDDELMRIEAEMAAMANQPLGNDEHPGSPSPYSCPDCAGVLFEIHEGKLVRYRCRVGHAWSSESLLGVQADNVDSALWMALRTLEEKASLASELSQRAVARRGEVSALRYREQAAQADKAARVIRTLLSAAPLATDVAE